MAAPIIQPFPQFCDANGRPFAGGTIETYIPGTDTPKDTWTTSTLDALNTNPIVLDAAGRCLWYGDGEYRLVLKDAVGNLIWDQVSTTIVSAAMAPVVSAPTLADARDALGIDDAIEAEAVARAAADSAEQTARIAADTAETNARTAADTTLQTNIDAEKTRAEAAEADLQDQISGGTVTSMRSGTGTTDGSGNCTVAFSPAFDTACDSLVACCGTLPVNCTIRVTGIGLSSGNIFIEDTNNTGGIGSAQFYWFAVGH